MEFSKGAKARIAIRKWADKLNLSGSQSKSSKRPGSRTLTSSSTTNLSTVLHFKPIRTGSRVPTIAEPAWAPTGAAVARKAAEYQNERAGRVAWTALRTSLRVLHQSSSLFPALSSALETLSWCIDGVEEVSKHRKDYEELATTLLVAIESLNRCTNPILLSDSMTYLALSLESQAMEIWKGLTKLQGGDLRPAKTNEDAVLRHYRKVQSLFRQLQTIASMSTLNTVNEQLANTRLEGLNPAKRATYNSDLSAEVSRRGCTEGTRTTVLSGVHDWLLNPSSASIHWMNGTAGTGKTTIAYTFCEQVEQRKQLAASFFCTRNAVECRSTSRIIPTIAYQLARYSIPYRSELSKILGHNPDLGSKHVVKQFEQLLRDPLHQVRTSIPDGLVVVIDALDECEDRNGVELLLDLLFRHASDIPLRFLITSRPEPEISSKMRLYEQSRAVIYLQDIETSLVRADIELYLTGELAFVSTSQSEVEQLSHRAGSLFIYAATLVRYILYGKRITNPRQRLQAVLSLASESTKEHLEIDALYAAILESTLHEEQMENEEAEDVKTVIRTVLFAQEPVDVKTIAVLGGLDDPERVMHALELLRSVIRQSEDTGLVATLHASFPDFLLNSKRSGRFYCDPIEQNQLLAQRCFLAMKAGLRFNICALDSSFSPDSEVKDLQSRIKANITPTLSYICQYWANHLNMSKRSNLLLGLLEEFLSNRLLFWMEVLNLRQVIPVAIDMIQKANHWANRIGIPQSEEPLLKLLEDSYSFITNFASSAASVSTPHIYISCLPFCSRSSRVYKHYWKRIQGLLELKGSLIDRRDSAVLACWNHEEFVGTAFSSDGARVIGGVGDVVMIRNVYNGTQFLGSMPGHIENICACSFSLDGSRAVSASKDGTIRIWDTKNGTLVSGPIEYNTNHIRSIVSSSGGIMVPTPFKYKNNYIKSIDLSPDGTRIAACFVGASTIYLWDATTGALLRVLDSHINFVNRVVMSPDGSVFASASDDTTVRLWNIRDGTPAISPYTGHAPDRVNCVTFTPDGTRLVSSSNIIHVWSKSDGSLIAQFGYDLRVCSLAVSPNGTQVASGSRDCTVWIWKTEDGTLLAGPAYVAGSTTWITSRVDSLTYTREGTRLVSRTADGTITVWPVHKDVSVKGSPTSYRPGGTIDSLIFSADGTQILTRDYGTKAVRKWGVYDGSATEVQDKGYPFLDAYIDYLPSPNGLYAVTITGEPLGAKMRQIIDTSDGSVILGPWSIGNGAAAMAFGFSQDSTKVAIGSPDGTVKMYDLKSRKTIAGPFSGHTGMVDNVAISPDSSLIASSMDSTVRIFNTRARLLDIESTMGPNLNSPSNHGLNRIYEGWRIEEDGWVKNSNSDLLFWVPLEFQKAWPSPQTSLVFAGAGPGAGAVQVPKQTLLLGEAWQRCYNSSYE